ncbi:MAG: hypothetical protein ABSG62_13975 [Terracidiphilus sp.]|jgi:hypothetical protein
MRQVLNEFEFKFSVAPMHSDVFAGPVWAPSESEAPAFAREPDRLSESGAEDGSCLQGLAVAIGLETATVLSLYGIWQVWHLFR